MIDNKEKFKEFLYKACEYCRLTKNDAKHLWSYMEQPFDEVQSEIDALISMQCTSPYQDSEPCKRIAEEREKIQELEADIEQRKRSDVVLIEGLASNIGVTLEADRKMLGALWDEFSDKVEAINEHANELHDENIKLLSQLPENMKHCTIRFKVCSKGHGRLTADNWTDRGCDTCIQEELQAEIERLQKTIKGEIKRPEIIKCCPFCGSHQVNICRSNIHACWIECAQCEARAPSHASRSPAIQAWNKRFYDDRASRILEDDDKDFVR